MPISPGITCVRIHVYMFVRMTIVIRINIYRRILTHTYYHDLKPVHEAVFLEVLDDIVRELEGPVTAGLSGSHPLERSGDLQVGFCSPLHPVPLQSR